MLDRCSMCVRNLPNDVRSARRMSNWHCSTMAIEFGFEAIRLTEYRRINDNDPTSLAVELLANAVIGSQRMVPFVQDHRCGLACV